jgi:hypothetical protein
MKPIEKKLTGAALRTMASTRRFPVNQIPALHFHAMLNEEASEVELMLA